MSQLMRLWHLSPSVYSIFKHACTAIQWDYTSDFWSDPLLCLLPYFMCANSEGSGETARMQSLAWAFAVRLCDSYHNLMSWLKSLDVSHVFLEHGWHQYNVKTNSLIKTRFMVRCCLWCVDMKLLQPNYIKETIDVKCCVFLSFSVFPIRFWN